MSGDPRWLTIMVAGSQLLSLAMEVARDKGPEEEARASARLASLHEGFLARQREIAALRNKTGGEAD